MSDTQAAPAEKRDSARRTESRRRLGAHTVIIRAAPYQAAKTIAAADGHTSVVAAVEATLLRRAEQIEQQERNDAS